MEAEGKRPFLVVGCGDVGTRLACRLGPERVAALVRTPESAERLRKLGVAARTLDLDRDVGELPWSCGGRFVWYLVPPPRQGVTDDRMARFLALLQRTAPPRRLVYLGTTGVYGDCGGAWVDENRPPAPRVDRARRRLHAEQLLQQWHREGGGELVLLRTAGIYGPGKLPLERLRARRPMLAREHAPWTNRIHVEDLVEVLAAAMERGRDGAIYNVSDGQPGNMADYFDAVADAAGLPRPPRIRPGEAPERLSPGLRAYLAESRRIDNRKMLRELGVTLRHPTLAEGLAASLEPPVVS